MPGMKVKLNIQSGVFRLGSTPLWLLLLIVEVSNLWGGVSEGDFKDFVVAFAVTDTDDGDT